MAEIRLTPAQQAAVENRGGALLVSAAAGSGKTKVLVDRLLSYVEDENDPANIDEFLIITYTKAGGKRAARQNQRRAFQALCGKSLESAPGSASLRESIWRRFLRSMLSARRCSAGIARCAICRRISVWQSRLRQMPSDWRSSRIRLRISTARASSGQNFRRWQTSSASGGTTGG